MIISAKRMKEIFEPRNIAVVGASTKNFWFSNVLMNAEALGFRGSFYPVNPTAQDIAGIKAYKSIEELPEKPFDFGVIMVRASMVMDTVRKLSLRGIKNMLLLTSGYAETGPSGVAMQEELECYSKENGILLMGPNCLGFMNPWAVSGVFVGGSVEGKPIPGNIGVVGQSGAASEIIVSKLIDKGLGISLYATTGNEAVITTEDIFEYLVNDGTTKVIAGFIEGFRNIEKLIMVSKEAASKGIPIIMIKVGRSLKAKSLASSHTGAMAGEDIIIDKALKQIGIIRVDSVEELLETVSIFSKSRLPKGEGVCIYSLSGGLCGMYADICDKYGIKLPELMPQTVSRLKEVLPEFAQVDNPLDVTGSGFQNGLDEVFDILLQDMNISVIAPLCISPPSDDSPFAQRINNAFLRYAGYSDKTIVPVSFREVGSYAKGFFSSMSLHVMEQPDIGLKALSHFINYSKFLKKTHETVL